MQTTLSRGELLSHALFAPCLPNQGCVPSTNVISLKTKNGYHKALGILLITGVWRKLKVATEFVLLQIQMWLITTGIPWKARGKNLHIIFEKQQSSNAT